MKQIKILIFILFINQVSSAAPLTEQKRIEYLFTQIQISGLKFVRNGVEYSPSKAVMHLKYKLSRSGGMIKTAEDFIRRIASKSSFSGKLYYIKMPDGKQVPSGDWLFRKLRKFTDR